MYSRQIYEKNMAIIWDDKYILFFNRKVKLDCFSYDM